MNISTRGRYGLRALMEIAQNSDSQPATIRDISRKQKIPTTYLEQILYRLRKAGLVRSFRGAKGGYMLAKKSNQITIREVVRALDGPIGIAYCDYPKLRDKSCIGREICPSGVLWKKLEETIDDFLSKITLADLKKKSFRPKRGATK